MIGAGGVQLSGAAAVLKWLEVHQPYYTRCISVEASLSCYAWFVNCIVVGDKSTENSLRTAGGFFEWFATK